MTPHKLQTISTGSAAQALDVDRKTILNWIAGGKINADTEQMGDRHYYRIPQAEVDRLLAQKKTPSQPNTG
jgi:excisionase family DNA binding protein